MDPTNPDRDFSYCIAYPYGDGTQYAYTTSGMGGPSYNTTGCPLGYPTVIPSSVKDPVYDTSMAFFRNERGVFAIGGDGKLYGWKSKAAQAANPADYDYIFADPAPTQITVNGILMTPGMEVVLRDDHYNHYAYCIANPIGDGRYYRATRMSEQGSSKNPVIIGGKITTEGCLQGVTAWN